MLANPTPCMWITLRDLWGAICFDVAIVVRARNYKTCKGQIENLKTHGLSQKITIEQRIVFSGYLFCISYLRKMCHISTT